MNELGKQPNRWLRWLWLVFGTITLGAGLVGVVLPLLPTTPFLLLAAFCFDRSSPRLHRWLIEHAHLGPPINDWRRHGAISSRAKRVAVLALALIFALSLVLDLAPALLILQASILAGVGAFILTRPSPPSDHRGGAS